ncbi:hypothetical protein [Arthrobacter oryzae]|nr:hypothetical protein [Arthrobacter oryzae]
MLVGISPLSPAFAATDPTVSPTPTESPTVAPTAAPTLVASPAPTASPTSTASPTPTPSPTPAPTPIEVKWASIGGSLGRLGNEVGTEVTGLANGGSMQLYDHGSIYYTAATGARVIEGSIGAKWTAAGAQNGVLGYPTTDIRSGLKDGGSAQSFASGTIVSSPATGMRTARGGIGNRWVGAGSQNSFLGYPTTDEIAGVRGGVYQRYQGGSIYWNSLHGASITHGAIGGLYASLGAERGRLGYPMTEEAGGLKGGGVFQAFDGGDFFGAHDGDILYTPQTGAHFILGGILQTWEWEYSFWAKLGYPITNEMGGLKGGGAYQLFQHGAIYYSPATRGWPVQGAIRSAWASTGAERGPFGYPTTGEFPSFGQIDQRFQNGSITYSPTTHRITSMYSWIANCPSCPTHYWIQ